MQSSEQVEEKLAGEERCKEVVDEFMVRVSFTSWSYFCRNNTVALLEVDGVLIDARDDSPPGSLVLEIWDDGYKKVEVLKWSISISALDQRFCLSGQIGGS